MLIRYLQERLPEHPLGGAGGFIRGHIHDPPRVGVDILVRGHDIVGPLSRKVGWGWLIRRHDATWVHIHVIEPHDDFSILVR